jgi:predicted nucleotidyltransferase
MEEIKEKIIAILNSKFDCEAIVIFGSFSRGTQNAESDVDIAIKVNGNITKKEIFEVSNQISDEIKRDVDLINLDTIENDGFKYEILINGIVVYCKDSYKFDLYKLDAYREYLELNESRQMIIDEMKK